MGWRAPCLQLDHSLNCAVHAGVFRHGVVAFSQGAVIWVYISEIFPTEVRARGQSLGASTHWLMDAIVASVFPAMAARSNGLPFILFALAMLVQLFVVARWFVETKGVRLEDIDV